jgi:hypothetical protein
VAESEVVVHIDVDEAGTKAGTRHMGDVHDAPQVRADRPYIAFVYDMTVDAVLFLLHDAGFIAEELRNN